MEKKGTKLGGGEDSKQIGSGTPIQELVIYFGSQTGTAAGFAKTLGEEATAHGIKAKVVDLKNFDPATLAKQPLVLFFLASFGKGGPTENAKKFYEWMQAQKETKKDLLKGTMFSIFGCGGSSYKLFNKMAKDSEKWILELGGKQIHPTGLGDAAEDIEADFANWKKGLWPILEGLCKCGSKDEKVSKVNFEFAEIIEGKPLPVVPVTEYDLVVHQYMTSKDIEVINMTQIRQSTEETSTYMIQLNNGKAGVTYATGETLAVFPRNNPEIVEKLEKLQGWGLKKKFMLIPLPGSTASLPFPGALTIEEALTQFCDLTGPLSKAQLTKLEGFAKDPTVVAKLISNYEEFKASYKSIVDVIAEASIKLSFVDFVEIANRIVPRYYTISSSSKASPNVVRLTVVLVAKTLGTGVKKGLCSDYFERMFNASFNPIKPGAVLPLMRGFVKPSIFNFPPKCEAPIIMIGPGTGIAPFIGYIEEREYEMKQDKATKLGPLELFFGCRYKAKDFIYAKELAAWKDNKVLTDLHLAFSRDTGKKIYVQDLLKEKRDRIVKYMKEMNGVIHVCGSLLMGNAIRTALVEAFKGHFPNPEAYLDELEKANRYATELWG